VLDLDNPVADTCVCSEFALFQLLFLLAARSNESSEMKQQNYDLYLKTG